MGQDSDRRVEVGGPSSGTRLGTKEFWRNEHPKFADPHYRLQKTARLINRIAGSESLDLLDVGCGPGTLARLLNPGIRYYGIDISVANPAPNLRELDILDAPVDFDGRRFDVVVSLGVFEYLGEHQMQKFAEIASLIAPGGKFLVSYTNFSHRRPYIYEAFTNVQSVEDFRDGLKHHFTIHQTIPTAYNWNHGQPRRRWLRQANMHLNSDLPWFGRRLAVEYYFICTPGITSTDPSPVTAYGS